MIEQIPVFTRKNITELNNNLDNYPNGFILILNKPYKWTSADAVRKIKFSLHRYFHKNKIKVGHAGTLDPLATGLLILCVGNATKKSEILQASDKEYIAKIKFGATTPSFDLEKEIDETFPFEHINREMIEEALKSFIGEQEQIPPKFSAKFINGVRAYEIARTGEEVEMHPAKIFIESITIIDFSLPELTIRIKCGKGTYIRSLARDIGIALKSGAHLTGLTRCSSGSYTLSDSIELNDLVNIVSKNETF
jgi:tRNA pseudouridine 55 synthase